MPARQQSVRLDLELPAQAVLGESVPITLYVENASDDPVDLHLRGREIAFDVVVTGPDGSPVWRRLEGEIIPAILQLRTLAPRQVLELRAEWNLRSNRGHPVGPGLYSVRGLVLTDEPQPMETPPAPLRIVSR